MMVDQDTGLSLPPDRVAESAAEAERLGYDAMWTPEAAHNLFIGLTQAATRTHRIELGTAIAV